LIALSASGDFPHSLAFLYNVFRIFRDQNLLPIFDKRDMILYMNAD